MGDQTYTDLASIHPAQVELGTTRARELPPLVRLSRIEALKGSVGAEDHHSELRSGVWASYGWGGQRADQVGYECSARNGIRFSESGFG